MQTDVPGDVAGLDDTLSVPPVPRPLEPEPESTRRIGAYRLLHLIGEEPSEAWARGESLAPRTLRPLPPVPTSVTTPSRLGDGGQVPVN